MINARTQKQIKSQYTVEQENFATWNFREFRGQAIRVQEIFANFWIAEVLSFPTVVSDWKSEHFQASNARFPSKL